ncbi:hypothetical protein KM043_009613 [Ampulex compressa]|nr:hypothetical protein KM043_009613 [Ampulex compressa]
MPCIIGYPLAFRTSAWPIRSFGIEYWPTSLMIRRWNGEGQRERKRVRERERGRERREKKEVSLPSHVRAILQANVATANPAEDRIVGGGEEDGTGEISGVPYLPAEPDRPRRWAGGVIGASGPFVSTTALGERRNSLPSCELLEIKAIMRVWYSLIARGSGFLGELEGTCFDSEVLPARCVWNIGGALNISV